MNADNEIRIIIADDHNLFRSGLLSLLSDESNLYVVAEASNGDELVEKYNQYKPDLLIVDISMPGKSGVQAVKEIKENNNDVKVLFLSMYEGDDYLYHCIKAGGNGLISKNILKGELIFAIKKVIKGDSYFGPDITEEKINEIKNKYDNLVDSPKDISPVKFSEREKKILFYISEGFTSNEIAEKLNISKRTIDSHRTHLMQKLNIKTLPELIRYALLYVTANRKI